MNNSVFLIFLLHLSTCFSGTIPPECKDHNGTQGRQRRNKINSPPRKPVLESFRMRYVKEDDFRYALFNKNHPNGVPILKEHQYKNAMDYVIPNAPIRFITHGWKAFQKAGFCHELKNEYLRNGKDQVIIADWEALSNELEYFELIEQTGDFAILFSKVLVPFVQKVGGKNMHILAEGVGAHLCGIAASIAARSTKQQIGRITAFDPSWNSFEIPSYGIQRSQAAFVDIIHTSAGTSGIPEPRGHVDFYINGGTAPQPGCQQRFMNSAIGVCSHNLSWGWFKNTINAPPNYVKVGFKCNSWKIFTIYYCSFTKILPFGQSTPTNAKGVYHLKMADWPFSQQDY